MLILLLRNVFILVGKYSMVNTRFDHQKKQRESKAAFLGNRRCQRKKVHVSWACTLHTRIG